MPSVQVNVQEVRLEVEVGDLAPTILEVPRGVQVVEIAQQGPPGPPGGARYMHHQATPSSTWIVNHGLGVIPVVQVLTEGGEEVEAYVLHTSPNQTIIQFAVPMKGFARFV